MTTCGLRRRRHGVVLQAVLAGRANAAVELEPAQIFERVLAADQRVACRVQPVVGARQQEAQRAPRAPAAAGPRAPPARAGARSGSL